MPELASTMAQAAQNLGLDSFNRDPPLASGAANQEASDPARAAARGRRRSVHLTACYAGGLMAGGDMPRGRRNS